MTASPYPPFWSAGRRRAVPQVPQAALPVRDASLYAALGADPHDCVVLCQDRFDNAMGGLFVPGLPDARPLIVESPPLTLPRAVPVTITARVKRLETETAFLVGVRVVDAKGSGLSLRAGPTKEFALARPGPFQKVAPGTVLQTAMDSHARIRLDVLAALDWASGVPVAFELARLPE